MQIHPRSLVVGRAVGGVVRFPVRCRKTQEVEFLHLDGNDLGRPTRVDDPRLHAIARANGWRARAELEPGRQVAR